MRVGSVPRAAANQRRRDLLQGSTGGRDTLGTTGSRRGAAAKPSHRGQNPSLFHGKTAASPTLTSGRARSEHPKPTRAAGTPSGRGGSFTPGRPPCLHPRLPVPQGRKATEHNLPSPQPPVSASPRAHGGARSKPGPAAGSKAAPVPPPRRRTGLLQGPTVRRVQTRAPDRPQPAPRLTDSRFGAGPAPPLTEGQAPRHRRLTHFSVTARRAFNTSPR